MSKYIVGVEESSDFMAEIEASSPIAAAEKFVNESENDVANDEVIIVCEKIHKFKVSFKKTVKLVAAKKSSKTELIS